MNGELIQYQTEDDVPAIHLQVQDWNDWFSQAEIAGLFQVTLQAANQNAAEKTKSKGKSNG